MQSASSRGGKSDKWKLPQGGLRKCHIEYRGYRKGLVRVLCCSVNIVIAPSALNRPETFREDLRRQ
jgi:hypothetical protein